MLNFVDLVIIILIVYLVWQGWRSGLIVGLLNLITTVVSLIAATVFYPQVGSFLVGLFAWGQNLSQVITFFSILIILEILLSFIANRLYSKFAPVYNRIEAFRFVDKALGIVPSVLVGLFLISLFLLLPLILPVQAGLKDPIVGSWWGKNVLPLGLKYQPTLETYLNRLPYQNLVYLITPEPSSKETVDIEIPTKIEFSVDQVSEKNMLELVNREREKRGLSILTAEKTLLGVARKHCLDMFERSYFSHYSPDGKSPFDRMKKADVQYLVAGENLAYAPNVEIAHQGLMNSPGHKENILRPEFGRLGVGVIDGGLAGKMFCQEFSD